MTVEDFNSTLIRLLDRTPFQAIRVELLDGGHFEIDRPKATAFRNGTAIFIGVGFKPVWFDHTKVQGFSDAPRRTAPRKTNGKQSQRKKR